jgi:hypothetical protein
MTVYCCAAVGGLLQHAMTGVRSGVNGSEEVVTGSEAAVEPLCETSNYNDSEW